MPLPGLRMRHTWISFSKNSPYDKTASSRSSFLRYVMSLDLMTIVNPLFPCNGCCTFGFLIFIIVERNFLYNSLYVLTEKSLKHLSSIRAWVPVSFFLSLSLPLANSLECGNPLSSLSCPGFQGPLERASCAFVSGVSTVLGFYWFSA